jgi:DNA-binding NtrC family response regulator
MNSTRFDKSEIEDYKGCAILVHSGDREFLDDCQRMFLSMGLTPVTSTMPEAARAILRLMIVACVVVDAESGPEACRQVTCHSRETQRQAPVIVVSRKPNPGFRDQAMTMGAADYLDHPILPDDMIHALLPGFKGRKQTAT